MGLTELKAKWQKNCIYDWFQGTEDAVKFTGGVCAMMTMDWLRRRFLNRKDYHHLKYKSATAVGGKTPGSFGLISKAADMLFSEQNPKRAKIMQRAAELQVLYGKIWQDYNKRIAAFVSEFESKNKKKPTLDDLKLWDAKAAAFHTHSNQQVWDDVKEELLRQGKFKDYDEHDTDGKKLPRGFERLSLQNVAKFDVEKLSKSKKASALSPEKIFENEINAAMLEAMAAISVKGTCGGYISLQFGGSAHAIGLFYTPDPRSFTWFDPNFGEYQFDAPAQACMFVAELLKVLYHGKTKTIEVDRAVLTDDPQAFEMVAMV